MGIIIKMTRRTLTWDAAKTPLQLWRNCKDEQIRCEDLSIGQLSFIGSDFHGRVVKEKPLLKDSHEASCLKFTATHVGTVM